MTDEYVRYNGIPHKVLPREQPEPKRDIVKDSLDLQRLILNPQDRMYIIPEQEQKLIARSAGSSNSEQPRKRFTVQDALDLQQHILGNL